MPTNPDHNPPPPDNSQEQVLHTPDKVRDFITQEQTRLDILCTSQLNEVKIKAEEIKRRLETIHSQIDEPQLQAFVQELNQILEKIELLELREKIMPAVDGALDVLRDKSPRSTEEQWLLDTVTNAKQQIGAGETFKEKAKHEGREYEQDMGIPVDELIAWLGLPENSTNQNLQGFKQILEANSIGYWDFKKKKDPSFDVSHEWNENIKKKQHIWTRHEANLISNDWRKTGSEDGDYEKAMKELDERKVLVFDKLSSPRRSVKAPDAPLPPPPPPTIETPAVEIGTFEQMNKRRAHNLEVVIEKIKQDNVDATTDQILAHPDQYPEVKQILYAEVDEVKKDLGEVLKGFLDLIKNQQSMNADQRSAVFEQLMAQTGLSREDCDVLYNAMMEKIVRDAGEKATKVGKVRKALRIATMVGGGALAAVGFTIGTAALSPLALLLAGGGIIGAKGLDVAGTAIKDFLLRNKNTKKETEKLCAELGDANNDYYKQCLDALQNFVADEKQHQIKEIANNRQTEELKNTRESYENTYKQHHKEKGWDKRGCQEYKDYEEKLIERSGKTIDELYDILRAKYPDVPEEKIKEFAIAAGLVGEEDELRELNDEEFNERIGGIRKLARGFAEGRVPFLSKPGARDILPGKLGNFGQITLGFALPIARMVVPGARILDRIGGALLGRQAGESLVAGIQGGLGIKYGDVRAADIEMIQKMKDTNIAADRRNLYQQGEKRIKQTIDRDERGGYPTQKGLPEDIERLKKVENEMYATARKQLRDSVWCKGHVAEAAALRQAVDKIDRRMVNKINAESTAGTIETSIVDESEKYKARLRKIAAGAEAEEVRRGRKRETKKIGWEIARSVAAIGGATAGAILGPEIFEAMRDRMQKGYIGKFWEGVPDVITPTPLPDVPPPPVHHDYQGGGDLWHELTKQANVRADFTLLVGHQIPESSLQLSGNDTWTIDALKDEAFRNPTAYGLPANVDIDHLTAEQLKHFDYDKLFNQWTVTHQADVIHHVSASEDAQIKENNRLLAKWQAEHPHETIESGSTEQNFADKIIEQMRAEEAAAAAGTTPAAGGPGAGADSGIGLHYQPGMHIPHAGEPVLGIGFHPQPHEYVSPHFDATGNEAVSGVTGGTEHIALPHEPTAAAYHKLTELGNSLRSPVLHNVDWQHPLPGEMSLKDIGTFEHRLGDMDKAINGHLREYENFLKDPDLSDTQRDQVEKYVTGLKNMHNSVESARPQLDKFHDQMDSALKMAKDMDAKFTYRDGVPADMQWKNDQVPSMEALNTLHQTLPAESTERAVLEHHIDHYSPAQFKLMVDGQQVVIDKTINPNGRDIDVQIDFGNLLNKDFTPADLAHMKEVMTTHLNAQGNPDTVRVVKDALDKLDYETLKASLSVASSAVDAGQTAAQEAAHITETGSPVSHAAESSGDRHDAHVGTPTPYESLHGLPPTMPLGVGEGNMPGAGYNLGETFAHWSHDSAISVERDAQELIGSLNHDLAPVAARVQMTPEELRAGLEIVVKGIEAPGGTFMVSNDPDALKAQGALQVLVEGFGKESDIGEHLKQVQESLEQSLKKPE